MSKGAYTLLNSYVGKQEANLVATKRLIDRLQEIYQYKLLKGNYVDPAEAIPTVSDIMETHAFFLKNAYKPHVAVGFEYFKKIKEGGSASILTNTTNTSLSFNLLGNNGDYLSDIAFRVVFEALGDANAPDTAPRYRYCDFPGMRLFKRIALVGDQADIDAYTTEDMLHYYQTRLDDEHKRGWRRMVGQEEIKLGYYYNQSLELKEWKQFSNGAQTFKKHQPELEIWLPLIFDFCHDPSRSIDTKKISSQQITISFDLAKAYEIVQAVDANGSFLGADAIPGLAIKNLEMYTRNIYLPQQVLDLFNDLSGGLQLVRVRKRQVKTLTKDSGRILFDKLKYPIETLNIGFRPNINNDSLRHPLTSFEDWWRMGFIQRVESPVVAFIDAGGGCNKRKLVCRTNVMACCDPIVDTLAFDLHGNQLYIPISEGLFNKYLPFKYRDVYPPEECGYYFLSFAFYPDMFNPSGHLNLSTAREFYLRYSSRFIGADNPTTLYVSAQAINFIIYRGDTFELKYIT